MDFESLIAGIAERMKHDLPGADSQYKMAPLGRKTSVGEYDRSNARESAVLILLYPESSKIFLPLMKRNEYHGAHSGQVSLPGGKTEEQDQNEEATAIRETQEELGIDPLNIQTIGKLTELFIPVSNFKVIPVIGINKERPRFYPDPKEVEQLLEIDIELLLDPKIRKTKAMSFSWAKDVEVPYFDLHGHVVWGATAMILSEFSQVLSDIQDS